MTKQTETLNAWELLAIEKALDDADLKGEIHHQSLAALKRKIAKATSATLIPGRDKRAA